MRLKNKVAIITGGAKGFGAAMVRLFVAQGAKVILADIDSENGQAIAAELGENCLFMRCDHCDKANNELVVKTAVDTWGGIDILINNAGIGWTGDFIDADDEVLQRLMTINLTGQWNLTQAALPELRKSAKNNANGTALLFTSSGLGLYGVTKSSAYTVSKHAVIGLMRSLAAELGPENIRVNAICPGIADTNLARSTTAWGDVDQVLSKLAENTPLRKLAEPIDIANAALFLASDEGRMVHCVALRVDGGAHT
ncbi:SDR family NAD(P)-dependent oxidoreductase [Rheinheimera salexigens]|uniref:Short-chain dehydrogenase n=1 Tax=Rheinheimera salexigens TaxID=1628148 RepID=A0A1E7Q3G0_9GAMM|nr:SDR family oxidoreductase [Rheinheimera salexigens]OEY68650.1 hypothetical protein BI198_02975 [Rheinheimera salexigens]